MLVRNWVLLVFISTSQLQSQNGSGAQALDRMVKIVDLKTTSADAVSTVLGEAGVPGEVVSIYDACSGPSERAFSLTSATTLRQALDYVATLDTTRKWSYRDGIVVVGAASAARTPLGTVLGVGTIDPGDSLTLATQKLLELKEVQDKAKQLRLEELSIPLGLSAIAKSGTGSGVVASKPIQLRGKTLEQALNTLASLNGKAAWHYEQFQCGPKTSFRVSWLIQ